MAMVVMPCSGGYRAPGRTLLHLATHSILQGLARLDKAGQSRYETWRPVRLPSQQALARLPHRPSNQHDHDRIGPWKLLCFACPIDADARVPCLTHDGWASTSAAKAVPAMPIGDRASVGEQGCLVRGYQGDHTPQVVERRALAHYGELVFFNVGEVACEPSARSRLGRGTRLGASEMAASPVAPLTEHNRGRLPEAIRLRSRQTGRIRGPLSQVFAQRDLVGRRCACPVQRAARVSQSHVHHRTLTQRRGFGNARMSGRIVLLARPRG